MTAEKPKKNNWYVYILECADGTLYTGVTTDIQRRLKQHNEASLGAKYTRARLPVTLAYKEKLQNRSDAQLREAAIKKLSRNEKFLLISTSNKNTKRTKKMRNL